MSKNIFLNLSLITLFSLCSCSLDNFTVTYDPLQFNVLAEKGDVSLSLYGYFDDKNLNLIDDSSLINVAFSCNENSENFAPIIICETLRGFDGCEQYGEFAYYGTITLGNQKIISLNSDKFNETLDIRLLANDENNVLGQTLKNITILKDNANITYLNYTNLDFYNYLFNGEYKNTTNNFVIISEPYATRLLTHPDSALFIGNNINPNLSYNEKSEKLEELYKETIYPYRNLELMNYDYRIHNLSWLYRNTMPDNKLYELGVPQTSIFIHKDFYDQNKKPIENFLFDYLEKIVDKVCVRCVTNTRPSLKNISKENNNDINLDDVAFKLQFDAVGISWKEAALLQGWHELYGESMSQFNGWPNGLEYVASISNYYTREHLNEFFDFIDRTIPNDTNFIK